MHNFDLKNPQYRWLAILAICATALILFIIFDYQNALSNLGEKSLTPEILGEIIFRTSIGFLLIIALLFLVWKSQAAENNLNQSDIDKQQVWLKDNLPFGVALWSDEGKLVDCNQQYQKRLELNKNDIIVGTDYVNTMGKIKSQNSVKTINDQEHLRQLELSHQDGSHSLIDERPLENGGFITLIFDISEKTRTKASLEKAQDEQRIMAKQIQEEKIKAEAASRAKTTFLAHLSHDINTPLNAIIGFADLMIHETYGKVGDQRYIKYLKDIRSSGEKLVSSFAEILELAQFESGEKALKLKTHELAKTLTTASTRHKDKAKRAGIKIETCLPDNVKFDTDKHCLNQMIGNIIENSIRFTPKGGVIKVKAWVADDGVVIEITDDGIGISEPRLKELEQSFVLSDAAFTRKGGAGLGIAISRAIAELHGGKLIIDSSPNFGTTVAISLPLKAQEQILTQVA